MEVIVNNRDPRWRCWQKAAFRWCFVFLGLQVLTENFLGNLFGSTLFIWRVAEKVFVPPCLWLNRHFFHFRYIPQTWTTFSGALHTIRDLMYLLLACIGAVIWSLLDRKRAHYNRLLYWLSRSLIAVLSSIMYTYGIIKVFAVQMPEPSADVLRTPVGNLSPYELIWATYGSGAPYQVFGGLIEVAGAILVLFTRTRVAGLLIIVSTTINIIMLNYTFQIGVLITSFYILIVTLFLLAPYTPSLVKFFFFREKAVLTPTREVPGKAARILKGVGLLLVCGSFILTTSFAYRAFNRQKARPVQKGFPLLNVPRVIIILDDTSDSE